MAVNPIEQRLIALGDGRVSVRILPLMGMFICWSSNASPSRVRLPYGKLPSMLLSLVCVSLAVVLVFSNGFFFGEGAAFQCVPGAPLITRSHF
jgi:hypothetical protein